jgi:amino acid adenylation domain-containing protein/non-ribosomal peptide synthase protein (TIGR01720 family)
VKKLNIEKIYGLTPMQEGILYHKLLNEDSAEYVLQSAFKYKGILNIEKMEQSLSLLAIKHEVLRTAFNIAETGIPLQVILRDRRVELNINESADESMLESLCRADISRGFDLKADSLLRVTVIRKSDEESVILWTMHHIISDGWCLSLLFNDFLENYIKLMAGNDYENLKREVETAKSATGSYQEYVCLFEQKGIEIGLRYWEQLLDGYSEPAAIAPIQAKETDNAVERIGIKIDSETSAKLQDLAQKEKITLNNIAEVAWGIVLQKYNRTEDVVFGKVVSGRDVPIKGIESIVGLFINTVPIRVQNNQNTTIRTLLQLVHKQGMESSEYDYCSLVEVQGRTELGRYLFSTLFVFENYYVDERVFVKAGSLQMGGSVIEQGSREQTNYDLTVSVHYSDCLHFDIMYDPKVYGKAEVGLLLRRIELVIVEIAADPDKRVANIELISDSEREMILHGFNDTYSDYPRKKAIHQLFEEQAERIPDNVALVFDGKSMTYERLNARANQVARVLRDRGVKPNNIVGIMVGRSFEMIVGILGILKAGGAYLPLDPTYPKDRIRFMMEDSEAKTVLTVGKSLAIKMDIPVLDLSDKAWHEDMSVENQECMNVPGDLAYCIYTSGTTGVPNGTLVEHKSVVRLVKNTNYIELDESSVIMQTGSMAFDASTFEVWGAFLNGGKLILANTNVIMSAVALKKVIFKWNVNTMFITTALYNQMIQSDPEIFSRLRYLLFGGEQYSFEHVKMHKTHGNSRKLIHVYGPTETTTFATYYEVPDDFDIVPIGKPLSNTQVYVMNGQQLSGVGVAGELCVSGDGLSRGYLNRPELTAKKFVENPFIPGERMYRTGDLARWLADGNIEFLGRIDHQVKIRGFRIELGEIESRLMELEAVKEAVVLAREEEAKDKYLCAYFVADEEVSIKDLRKRLSGNLPDYMIPSYFVQLDALPLNQNGKVDRKALPVPDGGSGIGSEYEAPRNREEEILTNIWSEVLGVEKIGINDNFFELGGHSLKGTVLATRIHRELNVELPLKELFKSPTVAGISEYLSKAKPSAYASIEAAEEKEVYEVSSAQKRMYVLQQLDQEAVGYNIPAMMMVDGKLEKEKLETAIRKLIDRHEVLRTSFETMEDRVVQRIHEYSAFGIEYADKAAEYTENGEKCLDESVRGFIRAFDLGKVPLLRVGLIKLAEEKHLLLFDMHHIISDGTSMSILTREFGELYKGKELKPQRIQYKDFSEWQNAYLKSESMQKQEKYWLEGFSDELPILNMPLDYVRSAIKEFDGSSIELKLGKELSGKLRGITKETGATLYMVLLSAINILLSKYARQEDIIVGSPIAGRPHVDLENMLGMFVNTLAMRNKPENGKTYRRFLSEVKENALKAYENQDYQFEELVDKLDLRRDMSRTPLFEVMFSLQNVETSILELEGLRSVGNGPKEKVAKSDLSFTAAESGDEILFNIAYGTSLFKCETIERLGRHLHNLLEVIVKDRDIRLGDIDILSEEERNKLLYRFNDTSAEYPREKTIHQLFEEQAARTPDNIALVFCEKRMSYSELNAEANLLARVLRDRGVKPDNIVGIMVERSFDMIIGILGILKAGGAYLPLDPEYPKERIRSMLEDSEANILLTQPWLRSKVEFDGEILEFKDSVVYKGNNRNLEPINHANDLAYAIYTSGSTGKPKGNLIEHRNVIRLLFNSKNLFEFKEEDVWTMFHSFCFDFSVWEMYGSLLYGGKLIIVDSDTVKDTNKFVGLLINQNVTILNQTPSAFYQLIREDEKGTIKDFALKQIILSGEKLNPELLSGFNRRYPLVELINMYGITETTIHVTYKKLGQNDINKSVSNIGVPIPTLSVYILDKNEKLCAINIPGELCVSGEGLARGYLNCPELTAEKFVDNPFIPSKRMCRTGDLARWLPDGNIEFLGRLDHQVKIRGFRIELEKIESRLLEIELVKEAVVVVLEDEFAGSSLCGYVVAGKELLSIELKKELRESLPDYMIPLYFVQLDELPLSSNGKIDRKALPKPDSSIGTGIEYEVPRNESEEVIAKIWSEVLDEEEVGIYDNFFELGGHSLNGTVVISRIRKELNVDLPLQELFKTPTIAGISEYLSKVKPSVYASIEVVEEKEYYEVSSAQKRMYVLQQLDLKGTGYNTTTVMKVAGALEKEKLKAAVRKLIKRHDVLRTSFEAIGDQVIQRIHRDVEFSLKYEEKTSEYAEEGEECLEEAVRSFIRPFDLGKAPLLRVSLIKLAEEKHLLLFDRHHIISDGTSRGILTREFVEFYGGKELELQRIQYKDFSEWQNAYLKSDDMEKQEKYWLEKFSDEIPVLNMPLDYTRPAVQEFRGDLVEFRLGVELSRKIKAVSRETGATLYMVLLSAVNILLSKYSGQEDIIIGSPIAGRPHADLENMLGVFINTLAMRNYPESGKSYKVFLKEVKENALGAYENQEYQFEELVDKLNLRRDMSRNPLFDVMFALQNMEETELEVEGLKFMGYEPKEKTAQFDLSFTAIEAGEDILIYIEYCTSLFKRETVERLSKHLCNLLKAFTENRSVLLGEIDILSEEERNELLYEFNDTYADYPREKTIHQLFEEQAERTPDNVALVFCDESMTYGELNGRANQVAQVLREKGVGPDIIVGIMMERSFEMIIGILGILKAGGAYLPIDPEYPKERIRFMLEDSEASILLTQSLINDKIVFDGEVIELDGGVGYDGGDSSNLGPISQSNDLAYVIYTSGSTGMPKGVLIEHQGVHNLLLAYTDIYELSNEDVVLQFANYIFDQSVWDIFNILIIGGTLCLISRDDARTPSAIEKCCKKNRVSVASFTPVLIAELNPEAFPSLRILDSTGEVANIKVLISWLGKCRVINTYGPTEVSVNTSSYTVKGDEEKNIPIGKPITNTQVYILRERDLCGIGIPGELCIAGEGVARGYLKRPELTAEKFVENPHGEGKMYRTGDLARWLPDGNIEYLGRMDAQVKIRGFRIELGEIENAIRKIAWVKDCTVVVRDNKEGGKSIHAYIVGYRDKEHGISEAREILRQSLPDYMIPAYMMEIEAMPLTQNGKLDKRALPVIEEQSGVEYIAPRTKEERIVAHVFSEIFDSEKVSAGDDVFNLGGDSIKAIRVVSKLREVGYELSVRDVMIASTVDQVSKMVKKREEERLYEQGEVTGEAPLTPIQKWFFASGIARLSHYNQSIILKTRERIETEGITAVLKAIVKHHDILRAVSRGNRQVLQSSQENVGYELCEYDCRGLKGTDLAKEIEMKNNELQSNISLEIGPLLKVGLFRTEEADHMMVCIHHLVVDGVSWRIFIEDLEGGYKQYLAGSEIKFSDKTASYKDWGEALQEYCKRDELKRELAYWRHIIKTVGEGIIGRVWTGKEGVGNINISLNGEETGRLLYQSGKAFGTEINDLLLSGLGLAVREFSGQEKIGVNMEGHGREEIHKKIDIDRTFGWFTSIYPIIIESSGDIREIIIRTKEMIRKIPNKGLGYGVLRYLYEESFGQEEVQVAFNYLGSIDWEIGVQAGRFEASEYSYGRAVALGNRQKELLGINCIIIDGHLGVNIGYRKDKLIDDDAKRFGQLYLEALREVINICAVQEEVVKTSSDFGLSDDTISQSELDKILKSYL